MKNLAAHVALETVQIINPTPLEQLIPDMERPALLVMLAAGKGTRFGTAPKCVQAVGGKPLARHTIDAFRALKGAGALVVVGYESQEVMTRLGGDNLYVLSSDYSGGTALASYEALAWPELMRFNPLIMISMGDRIIPKAVMAELMYIHCHEGEADLTLLTVQHHPPTQHGKGRILRQPDGSLHAILEQKDIDHHSDPQERRRLESITETNCPLYLARARTLRQYLGALTNDNFQEQYYLTDIVAALVRNNAVVRTLTLNHTERDYPILCADVTRPPDLARLESLVALEGAGDGDEVVDAACEVLAANRSQGQSAAIAAQLEELYRMAQAEGLCDTSRPVAIGVSGGRLRVAFMHPDMSRFYGPAWQMPTGSTTAGGRGQLVVLAQQSEDGRIHHFPLQADFREKITSVLAVDPCMFPPVEVDNLSKYEDFGTRLAERLLLSLGYFSDYEIQSRRAAGLPLPPHGLWVNNSMRRPFSLICNAIASLRTIRRGVEGCRIERALGKEGFKGVRILTTGEVPQGGFSSSSALTVAVKNALNVLYGFGLPEDTLIHLACQAEYGTGVRAGSLDQATEQKGRYGQGTLISSNPRDNYRTLGVFPIPTPRIHFIFPYSVDRDREAWRWSAGYFGESPAESALTTIEARKLTGKAAEIAALYIGLPDAEDFFTHLEHDLLSNGFVGPENQATVYQWLSRVPLRIARAELYERLMAGRDGCGASVSTKETIEALFNGWREPTMRRISDEGHMVEEKGVPLRAILGYLFVECARCFRLVHEPDAWIEHVTLSQRGDCCFNIDPANLPSRSQLLQKAGWERTLNGPALLEKWLRAVDARPFDHNLDLDDQSLSYPGGRALHQLRGGNFMRGLALFDLAEAMLKAAFGASAVALRVNAAGQGDYFQVHIDTELAHPNEVKEFLNKAFYERFGLNPTQRYVEPQPGGGAAGVRLNRFDQLPLLVAKLRQVGNGAIA